MEAAARWLAGPEPAATRFGDVPKYRGGLYRLCRSTYAWMVPNGSWGETNLGLIDCGRESVLVDTAWDVRFTREFLGAASEIVERAPVGCVVNTHADGDHCWGNQLFAGHPIIGSHRCIAQMEHLTPRTLHALKRGARWAKHVRFGGISALGEYLDGMFGPYSFDGIHLTKPSEGFSGEKTLTIGGSEIVLQEVGPAHTDGDVIVYVPAEKVAYTGDILFVGVTPVMWAGPVENLVSGLRRLLSLEAEVFVPGHGPLATRGDIRRAMDYWDIVQEGLHSRSRIGMPPAEAARSMLESDAFRRAGFNDWDLPERLVTSAFTMYRNWGCLEARLPERVATMNILRLQATLSFAAPGAGAGSR